MVFKGSDFFIVNKDYLNANFFQRKGIVYSSKNFFLSLIVAFGLRLLKYFLRSSFVKFTAVTLLLFSFFNEPWVLFLKHTFFKYKRFMMLFLKTLVVHCAWFTRSSSWFKKISNDFLPVCVLKSPASATFHKHNTHPNPD